MKSLPFIAAGPASTAAVPPAMKPSQGTSVPSERHAPWRAFSLVGWLLSAAPLFTGCHHAAVEPVTEASKVKVDGARIFIPADSPQLSSLKVETAQPCVASKLQLTGRLTWDDNVTVRVFSPFGGRVSKILVETGQTLETDAELARIASPDYGQAQADLRKSVSDLTLAERTVARVRELFEHGAAPRKDLQSAEADLSRAQSEKQRAEARMTLYGGNPNAVDQLYPLKTPIGGIVVEKNLNPGQEVRPDQMLASAPQLMAPLFVVTDPARLWVQIDANEADLGNLKPGQPFKIQARGYPGREFDGRIEFFSDFLDPVTRTVKIRGTVDNAARLLKAEMFVTIELQVESQIGFDVPAKAVFLKGEKHYLFIEDSVGEFTRREIKPGPEHDGKIRIPDGLKAGQRVVGDGSMLLEQLFVSEGA